MEQEIEKEVVREWNENGDWEMGMRMRMECRLLEYEMGWDASVCSWGVSAAAAAARWGQATDIHIGGWGGSWKAAREPTLQHTEATAKHLGGPLPLQASKPPSSPPPLQGAAQNQAHPPSFPCPASPTVFAVRMYTVPHTMLLTSVCIHTTAVDAAVEVVVVMVVVVAAPLPWTNRGWV